MATPATDGIEEITKGKEEKVKDSKDDSETQITVCTWNINGTAKAKLRKRVTTATFDQQQYQDGTTLGQSDIICVQEMTTNPEGATTPQYLPFARDYGVVQSKEPTGNIYNAVYFNQEKFSQVDDECLTQAYDLMDFKKRCYDEIHRTGKIVKKKVVRGQLEVSVCTDNDKKKRSIKKCSVNAQKPVLSKDLKRIYQSFELLEKGN
jgi:exonuclease III